MRRASGPVLMSRAELVHGESMTVNLVLQCIIMYSTTSGGHCLMAIIERVHGVGA